MTMLAPIRYLSVCSGIEAASVAWHPLGWHPAAFSEIEPFPRAVLAERWPGVPLHGDFTTISEDDYGAIDLLVGGTPCQPFSVAGLRRGMADPRGNLALGYLGLAARKRPQWVAWENVFGVLSSNEGRDFGSFLGGLVELGYGFAYRVLDAQYFGVPQRRRRVFVVGHLGDWRPAAAVLLERESLLGNPPPRREAGAGVAPCLSARTQGGGGLGTDFETQGGLIPQAFGGNNTSGPIDVAPALNACASGSRRMDFESEAFIAHTLRGEGFDASEDGTGRGIPLVPVAFDPTQITSPGNHSAPRPGDACHPLAASAQAPAIAFDCKASAGFAPSPSEHVTPTLRSMGHRGSHQNAGGQIAVAVSLRGREGGATAEMGDDIMPSLRCGGDKPHALTETAVRRLTPRECERLQGFPDDYTLIPWRGKPVDQCPDGPRYKALGNSMAVPVMAWIGRRIEMVRQILAEQTERSAAE